MILDRYLVREIALSSLLVALGLVAIFLGYSLTRFLTDAAGGLLKAGEVAHLTVYKGVIALEVLLPLALYFGLIVGFGRLNSGAEIVAMRAGGLSRRRMQRPLVLLSLLLAAGVALLSTTVRPWAYEAIYALLAEAEAASELARIKPGRFYLFEGTERSVYVEAIGRDGANLEGVFIRTRANDATEVISANSGVLHAHDQPRHHRLDLSEASIYKSVADGLDVYAYFDRLTLYLAAEREIVRDYRSKAEPTTALMNSAAMTDRAEFQWRLSTPVSTLLLALVALRFTDSAPREGKYARIPVALAVYAVYYNLLGLGRTWVEHGTVGTIWWVPALLAGGLALVAAHPRTKSA